MTNYELMEAIGRVDDEFLLPCLEERKVLSMKRSVKIAILAAALLILLATAAVALSGPDGFLSRLFGESYDIIGDYVMMEPISAENDKARLTVESALSDGHTTYIVFSIERLDGGTLDGASFEMEIEHNSSGPFLGGGSSTGPFETGNETPQKKWYLWIGTDVNGLESVDFCLLGFTNSETREYTDIGEIKLKVAPKLCPVKLGGPGGDPEGRDVFSTIQLSPIGFRIEAHPNVLYLKNNGSEYRQENANPELGCTAVLVYKDGTEQDISEHLERRYAKLYEHIRAYLETPLDIELVAGVRVNGEYFPLEYGEPVPGRRANETNDMLAHNRDFVFGDHEPLYPVLSAQSDTVTLSVESIWTDGEVVEIFFFSDFANGGYKGLDPVYGGIMDIRAVDKDGELLAVNYQPMTLLIDDVDGVRRNLNSAVIYIGGKAETLTLEVEGAELEIPLDMRKLKRLPKGEAYVRPTREPEPTADPDDIYAAEYEHLFGELEAEDVNISADNGEYRVTIEKLYHKNSGKTGVFKAMIVCEQLDGDDYKSNPRIQKEWELLATWGDRSASPEDSNIGLNSWQDGSCRYVAANWKYSFLKADIDAVRIVWTPPSGERIEIDIPVE